MKFLSLIVLTLVLAGCANTAPVKPKFPDTAAELMVGCPELKETPAGTTKLSEVVVIITQNYKEYHICRSKVDSWIEWYGQQRKIYEDIK